jgi:thiol-disulfide isomerase/thioredoxin
MNRRRLLSALAGLGLTGGSLFAVSQGLPGGPETVSARVETIDARGSDAGRVRVPVPGQPVTVLDLFATWCGPCREQMEALGTVHREYGDRAAFVSVTNERVGGTLTRADIQEWWQRHDGDWTVGLDPESDLMAALGADGLPYLAVVGRSGTVRWAHAGLVDAGTLRDQLDRHLEA